jgi:hypothetical protein
MEKSAFETSWPHWFDRGNPPRLDLGERPGTLSLQAIRALERQYPERFADARGRVALGLIYLWHDHWEEAHHVAQADEGEAHHDLLHAILHRRERDFSNSGYWFRGAGRNAAFELLAERSAKPLLESDLRASVLPEGRWDSAGFLAAVRRGAPGHETLLRALQAEEIIAFFETLAR